jgi:glycyl-tRNA synthetase
MEIEYFFDPEKNNWEELFAKLKEDSYKFITEVLEIDRENLRLRDHEPDELSHYSKGTTDIEYKFPFGWGELCAAGAYRTGYDLTQHQNHSGESLGYREENSKETIIPHVIEPSFGMDRAVLTVMIDSFKEQVVEKEETRRLMQFPFDLAPFKIAVLPLMKKDGLKEFAEDIYQNLLKQGISCDYDEAGSIGKRYRRQDENGTPWCITVDYESKDNQTVTLRHRDTMEQSRIKIEEIGIYLNSKNFQVSRLK